MIFYPYLVAHREGKYAVFSGLPNELANIPVLRGEPAESEYVAYRYHRLERVAVLVKNTRITARGKRPSWSKTIAVIPDPTLKELWKKPASFSRVLSMLDNIEIEGNKIKPMTFEMCDLLPEESGKLLPDVDSSVSDRSYHVCVNNQLTDGSAVFIHTMSLEEVLACLEALPMPFRMAASWCFITNTPSEDAIFDYDIIAADVPSLVNIPPKSRRITIHDNFFSPQADSLQKSIKALPAKEIAFVERVMAEEDTDPLVSDVEMPSMHTVSFKPSQPRKTKHHPPHKNIRSLLMLAAFIAVNIAAAVMLCTVDESITNCRNIVIRLSLNPIDGGKALVLIVIGFLAGRLITSLKSRRNQK